MDERPADDRSVAVAEETLIVLTLFADSHGDEHSSEELYRAVRDAKRALGVDDPEPYMTWDPEWGDKPAGSDG